MDDDDAFLYGDGEGEGAQQTTSVVGNGEKNESSDTAKVETVTEQKTEGDDEDEEEEDEDDDEDEEEEDSDSDLEIIVDSSAVDAKPPPGYNARPIAPYNKSLQTRPPTAAISTEYTPLTRPGQNAPVGVTESSNALPSVGDAAEGSGSALSMERKSGLTPAQMHAIQQQQLQQQIQTDLPEGPPPPAPITAPAIDLDPSGQALMLPPDVAGGEPGPLIYHIDPEEMEEKPWRKPGADLSDWFNYGLNEESWRVWGEKKTRIRQERVEMEKEGLDKGNQKQDHLEYHQFDQQNDNLHQQQLQQQQQQQFNIPPQQLQMMQAMMASSGMNMPPDQMMAFMGIQPGGGFSMGPSNPMMGMMGMSNGMGGGMGGMGGMGNMAGMGGGMGGMGMGGGFPYNSGISMMQQNQMQNYPSTSGVQAEVDDEEEYEPTDDQQPDSQNPAASVAIGDQNVPQMLPNQPLPIGEINGTPPVDAKGDRKDRARSPLPTHVPTGPKNPGRRYNDRDTGAGAADSLDYGAGGGSRDESDERRSSAQRSPVQSREPPASWGDNEIPSGPRKDREHSSRRHTSRRDDENDSTPRSSRYDDDQHDEGRRRTHSSRSTREKTRSDRRKGGAGEVDEMNEIEEEEEEDDGHSRGQKSSSKGRSSNSSAKSRTQARSERRAGREGTAETVGDEEPSHSTSSRRSRKRTSTEDGDRLTPPREPRRRRG